MAANLMKRNERWNMLLYKFNHYLENQWTNKQERKTKKESLAEIMLAVESTEEIKPTLKLGTRQLPPKIGEAKGNGKGTRLDGNSCTERIDADDADDNPEMVMSAIEECRDDQSFGPESNLKSNGGDDSMHQQNNPTDERRIVDDVDTAGVKKNLFEKDDGSDDDKDDDCGDCNVKNEKSNKQLVQGTTAGKKLVPVLKRVALPTKEEEAHCEKIISAVHAAREKRKKELSVVHEQKAIEGGPLSDVAASIEDIFHFPDDEETDSSSTRKKNKGYKETFAKSDEVEARKDGAKPSSSGTSGASITDGRKGKRNIPVTVEQHPKLDEQAQQGTVGGKNCMENYSREELLRLLEEADAKQQEHARQKRQFMELINEIRMSGPDWENIDERLRQIEDPDPNAEVCAVLHVLPEETKEGTVTVAGKEWNYKKFREAAQTHKDTTRIVALAKALWSDVEMRKRMRLKIRSNSPADSIEIDLKDIMAIKSAAEQLDGIRNLEMKEKCIMKKYRDTIGNMIKCLRNRRKNSEENTTRNIREDANNGDTGDGDNEEEEDEEEERKTPKNNEV